MALSAGSHKVCALGGKLNPVFWGCYEGTPNVSKVSKGKGLINANENLIIKRDLTTDFITIFQFDIP